MNGDRHFEIPRPKTERTWKMESIEERIRARNKIRRRRRKTARILISQSIDDYIEYRIQADKRREGILKDIQETFTKILDDFENLEVPEDFPRVV